MHIWGHDSSTSIYLLSNEKSSYSRNIVRISTLGKVDKSVKLRNILTRNLTSYVSLKLLNRK